jgi:hypothetical protein
LNDFADLSAICRIGRPKLVARCNPFRLRAVSNPFKELGMAIDESKLNEFMGKFVGDLGAVMHAATVVVGDKLGLYKTLAEKPASSEDLARRTEPTRAICASGWRARLRAATCNTTPRATPSA